MAKLPVISGTKKWPNDMLGRDEWYGWASYNDGTGYKESSKRHVWKWLAWIDGKKLARTL